MPPSTSRRTSNTWRASSTLGLLESGILLTSIAAVLLNIFFNGARDEGTVGAIEAAKVAEAH